MGQYYRIIARGPGGTRAFSPADCDCGLKLMEFSYSGNAATELIDALLASGESVVVCGDYAWGEGFEGELRALGFGADPYAAATSDPASVAGTVPGCRRYLANLDRGVYVDRSTSPVAFLSREGRGPVRVTRFDPAPLLLAVGNGLGGGDYMGPGEGEVGSWAGQRVVTTDDDADLGGLSEVASPFDEFGAGVTGDDATVARLLGHLVPPGGWYQPRPARA